MSGFARARAPLGVTEMVGIELFTRRQLVGRGARLGAAAALAPSLLLGCGGDDEPSEAPPATGGDGPRVAIVGAGLAGLSCAERLHRRGVATTVYEANPERIGGRCWTSRGWADGQIAEHGGEFIDTGHARIRALAKRLDLQLDDLYRAPLRGSSRTWLNGRRADFSALRPPLEAAVERLRRDAARVGAYGYEDPSPAARAMDEMSVLEWLDENMEGGSGSDAGHLVWAQMAAEFGLDADELSALNLIYEYVSAPASADERFHVRGGNDQLVDGLARLLPEGTIRLDAPLEAIGARDGGYALRVGGIAEDVAAEVVVLCLPFTLLREVDLDSSGLSEEKRRCVEELGMGTNAKVLLQTERRPVDYAGWNGYMLSDDPLYSSWESSLAQAGRAGLITTYLGGASGGDDLAAAEPHAPASAELAAGTLEDFQRAALAPIAAEQIGEAWADRWSIDPWTRGSYAAFLPGQYTRFYGFAGLPEGGIHFAGEHTATDFQGYLEGAVESGERAADEVAAKLGARAA